MWKKIQKFIIVYRKKYIILRVLFEKTNHVSNRKSTESDGSYCRQSQSCNKLRMGNTTSQTNARSLRKILEGLDCVSQHVTAIQWARQNNRVIDLFGDFAKNRSLLLFQSGNENENWLDPTLNLLYKMNTLSHVGDDLLKLFDRIDVYNSLFPETALHLIGFQVVSKNHAYPVFSQEFIDNVQFATKEEINEYMEKRGFHSVSDADCCFANDYFILSDIKPKNVLRSDDGIMYVIDAEIRRV